MTVYGGLGSGGFSSASTETLRHVKVRKSANQTGADYRTRTEVTWNSEDWDTDGFHDNATNNQRLTIPGEFDAHFVDLTYQAKVSSVTIETVDMEFRMDIVQYNSSDAEIDRFHQHCENASVGPGNILNVLDVQVSTGDYFVAEFRLSVDASITFQTLSFFGLRIAGR